MPSASTATNPHGWTIVFDEETHTYTTTLYERKLTESGAAVVPASEVVTDDTGKVAAIIKYTSGTGFVHHFFPPFDPDGSITANKARKMGISVDQLKFQWKQNSMASCEMGTRVHEVCEDVLHGRKDLFGNWDFRNQPKDECERKIFAAGFKAASQVLQTMTVIGIEQVVFDLDTSLAGTIDLLTKDADGTWWVLDWKTNKKIDFHNTFSQGRMGLRPIAHLENCNFVHYSLQLNLYEYIMRKADYVPHDAKFRRGIFHLTEDGPKFYEMPDLQLEVRDMVIKMLEEPPF